MMGIKIATESYTVFSPSYRKERKSRSVVALASRKSKRRHKSLV